MTVLKNIKHYNNLFWLFYKYWDPELLKEFSKDIDIPQILKERGADRGKANELVKDLESLGPFYIKLGQIFSTQAQFLPPEYEAALQKLQDKATPMSYADVSEIIEKELGSAPNKIFNKFQKKALSAASLGQLHLAELSDGKKVAVKIQRKDIQEDLFELLEALEKLSHFLEEQTDFGKKHHVIEKFEYLRTTILNELDYTKEANNLKVLHENLKEFERLIIPLPVDAYTTSRVLTMDYIKAERVTELTSLEKIDMETFELAEDLFRAFLKQIFVDGFFHMDPHPGNVYLTKMDGEPALAIFDLGMVTNVPSQMQSQMIKLLFAMSEAREVDVTKILMGLGKELEGFDEYLLRTKIADVIGQSRSASLSQISIGKIVLKLAQIAAEAGLWLPIQFNMIGKAFLSLDPVLESLDPGFTPNAVFQENAYELFRNKLSKQLNFRNFYGTLLETIDFIQQLPGRLSETFDIVSKHNFTLNFKILESEMITKNFEKIANRITMGLILASLVISAALLMRVETSFQLFGYPGFAMILFLMAATGGVLLIISILLSDRRERKK